MCGSDDFGVYVWRIPDYSERPTVAHLVKDAVVLRGHRSIVNQVRFSKVNHVIMSAGVEKILKLWSLWPFPKLNEEGEMDKPRPVYTHQEYINMVMSHGSFMTHDYSTQSVEEDTRMLAFFDSLIQREIDGFSDYSDLDSDLSESEFVYSINRPSSSRSLTEFDALSNEVVDSESTSDDEGYTAPLELQSVSSLRSISPFSVAYASYLGFNMAPDHPSTEASTSVTQGRQLPDNSGYTTATNAERDITQLIQRKRSRLPKQDEEFGCPTAKKRSRSRRSSCPSLSTSSAPVPSISVEEVARRIRAAAAAKKTRRQQLLCRIRQRTLLDFSDDDNSDNGDEEVNSGLSLTTDKTDNCLANDEQSVTVDMPSCSTSNINNRSICENASLDEKQPIGNQEMTVCNMTVDTIASVNYGETDEHSHNNAVVVAQDGEKSENVGVNSVPLDNPAQERHYGVKTSYFERSAKTNGRRNYRMRPDDD